MYSRFFHKAGLYLAATACLSFSNFAAPTRADGGAAAQNNQRFKVGDAIEIFSAGEALHGVIIGGYEDSGFGYGTYLVRLDNNYEQKYNVKFVQARFQPDSKKRFNVGDSVQARRWDGTAYPGKIVGVDGMKYQVSYQRDGVTSTEWFHVYNLRETNQAKPVPPKPGDDKKPEPPRLPVLPGQKIKVGDHVKYNDPGFVENPEYGTVIAIDAQKRMYQIRNEKDASLRYSYPCYAVLFPEQKIDNTFYFGKWQVYTHSALTTQAVTGSAKLSTLEIKADGTYIWGQTTGNAIRGRWLPRKLVRGVTLLKGVDGTDWTIYEKTEAFATTKNTRDEIGLTAASGRAGFLALRIGANQSCILKGRF